MTVTLRETKTHIWIRDVLLPQATDECIEWPFSKRDGDGYGQVRVGMDRMQVTHLVLALTGRPRPEDGQVVAMHTCDTPPCCNPRHLRWGTLSENVMDMNDKGRGNGMPEAERGKNTTLPPNDHRHGKATTYTNWGCRCRPCTDAATEQAREAREARRSGKTRKPSADRRRSYHQAVQELIRRHADEFEAIREEIEG